jgi:hypothetical protein
MAKGPNSLASIFQDPAALEAETRKLLHPNKGRDVDVAGLLHDAEEEALAQELEKEKSRRALRAVKKVWKTKEGRLIPYKEMQVLHLVDVLLFIRRKCQKKIEELAAKDGFAPGHDGWRALEPPEWPELIAELRSRGDQLDVLADLIDSPRATPDAAMVRAFLQRWDLLNR